MDPQVLQRARARDVEAFELIVLAKTEALLRTARAILGDDADARDAVQETFITAWRRLPQLRQLDRFDAWLGRTLINECRDGLRRRRRVRNLPLAHAGTGPPLIHSDGASAELREAFAHLSFDQRALLVLHHLHGYGVAQIGELLGVPVGTVKWRLNRARTALRAELERDR